MSYASIRITLRLLVFLSEEFGSAVRSEKKEEDAVFSLFNNATSLICLRAKICLFISPAFSNSFFSAYSFISFLRLFKICFFLPEKNNFIFLIFCKYILVSLRSGTKFICL